MGLTPFLALTLQSDPVGGVVVDADPEFLPGIGAVFVFLKAPVIIIVKIQAADGVGAGSCHMAVQRDQVGDPVFQQLNLGSRHGIFQLMTVFCCILFCHFLHIIPFMSAVTRRVSDKCWYLRKWAG